MFNSGDDRTYSNIAEAIVVCDIAPKRFIEARAIPLSKDSWGITSLFLPVSKQEESPKDVSVEGLAVFIDGMAYFVKNNDLQQASYDCEVQWGNFEGRYGMILLFDGVPRLAPSGINDLSRIIVVRVDLEGVFGGEHWICVYEVNSKEFAGCATYDGDMVDSEGKVTLED
jgi:hypothetical protein